MKTAELILDNLSNFTGHAALYKLSEPLAERGRGDDEPTILHDYVVCSTSIVMYSGVETYIFAANEKGEVTDWGELEGSARGVDNHREVLEGLGYEWDGEIKLAQ